MDLIVTHNNADFDAFSSLVAAKKLYPGAKLLLPGSQEKSLREFLSLAKDKIAVENERTCPLNRVRRLIIVDTRQKPRIGAAASLLANHSVDVHIYDHHPRAAHDIKGSHDVFKEVGATVTILLEILRKKKGVHITPLEATIMLLGIYEETGSLTYRTTTKLDVDTVSYLLSKGANLQAAASYINRHLTEAELAFLITLLDSTKVFSVNGVNVAIAEGNIKGFVGELGTIVRKLQDIENFPILFVVFRIGEKIRLMARSRFKGLDVNRLLKQFGGGGHRSAASAKINASCIEDTREKLLKYLKYHIKVNVYASDIMSSPVKTITGDYSVKNAEKLLREYKLKGLPVVEKNRIIGMITLGDIRKALKYKYAHASIKGYMQRSVVTVKPNTPLHVMQRVMLEKRIGRFPVVKKRALVGIVTRTDILKSVHKGIFEKKSVKNARPGLNVTGRMKKTLPAEIQKILHTIGSMANKADSSAFVVGGLVRDLILGVKNFDLDIVIEGNAIDFGKALADHYKGSLVVHKKFGTCTIFMNWPKGLRRPANAGQKFKIDLATARRESYESPAALPTVEFSTLKDDLRRRDFTINAMAASLNKKNFGQLVDFFGGENDLERGVIRVLHDASFIDDPTRIFRAVRFEQRFDFHIDGYTENLIKHAIREEMFKRTENQRIRDELVLMLQEENPLKAIMRMKELGELRFIHKRITVTKEKIRLFKKLKGALIWYSRSKYTAFRARKRRIDRWVLYLMALLLEIGPEETRKVCEKFALTRMARMRLISCKRNFKKTMKVLSQEYARPSEVYSALASLSFEEILFIRASAQGIRVRKRIDAFFREYSDTKIKIGGNELKKLGAVPGPVYRKILTRTLHKKLDGELKTKKDEIEFAKKCL
ncbi:MAG: CBS domain-containing protein [Candidatus Omnitrophica bacterium]|nr:CBS domain-containing protein [Candidatus Omnitrophota bacterium]